MSRHVVASVRELPEGSRKAVTLRGRPVVVYNVGGAYFGLLDRCPHQGARLSDGIVGGVAVGREPGKVSYLREGEFIRCPWHGWEFEIRSGQSWCDPNRVRARTYPVTVSSGNALVEGPFRAETFPVAIEDDYVVIEL